jgi:hypothetical protein
VTIDQFGRSEEAVAAYDSAIDLTHDTAERQYLQHRRDAPTAVASTASPGYGLGSERGSPNDGRTLFSKRVRPQIRSPVRVRT